MTFPRLPSVSASVTPTADDIENQLQQKSRLKSIGRFLRALGLMKLEDTEDVGLTNFKSQMAQNPLNVLAGIQKVGRTPDSETFLKSIKPDLDEQGFQTIFPPFKGDKPLLHQAFRGDKPIQPMGVHQITPTIKLPPVVPPAMGVHPVSQTPELLADVDLDEAVKKAGIRAPVGIAPLEYLTSLTREQKIQLVKQEQERNKPVFNPEAWLFGQDTAQATARFNERLEQDPNEVIRWSNTPKDWLLRLRPTDVVGIAAIITGGIQAIRSLTEFSRLPQYRAMVKDAKVADIPKDSPEFMRAKNTLQTAFNLKKQGASEAADAIMAEFNRAYNAAHGITPKETTLAGTPSTGLVLPQRPVPQGTQTGALAFGGKTFKPSPEAGQSIAAQLGIKFDGIQPGAEDIPNKMQFTDSVTGSTTYGNSLEEVKANIEDMRAKFTGKGTQNVPVDVDEAIRRFEAQQKEIKAKTRYGIDITKATEAEYVKAGLEDAKDSIKGTGFALDIKKQIQNLKDEYAKLKVSQNTPATPASVKTLVKNVTIEHNQWKSSAGFPQENWSIKRDDGLELGTIQATDFKPEGRPNVKFGATLADSNKHQYFTTFDNAVKWMDKQKRRTFPINRINEALSGSLIPTPASPLIQQGKELVAEAEKVNPQHPDVVAFRNALNEAETVQTEATAETPAPKQTAQSNQPPPGGTIPPQKPIGGGQPYHPYQPPVAPGTLSENVIGLRTIQPGLTRQQVFKNWTRTQFSKLYKKIGGHDLVLEDRLANPAMEERARVKPIINSQAQILADKTVKEMGDAFKTDKQGRIPSLAHVIPELGAPTIQDVAARLPLYQSSLLPEQLQALNNLRDALKPYRDLLTEVGVELRTRGDVMDGGFYIPRAGAQLAGEDLPYKVSGGRTGTKKGFEKPAVFDSMAQGIDAGYEYHSLHEALSDYVKGAGQKATDAHITNYFKTLKDDTGQLLGETQKMRMLRQNPGVAQVVEEIKANLQRLKSNLRALTERQEGVIDLWANDPDFADTSEVIISLQDALSSMKGGKPIKSRTELAALVKDTIDALKDFKPEYDRAMRQAAVTPRDQGVIGGLNLQGKTFPLEVANAVNQILRKEGALSGAGHEVSAFMQAFNSLYAVMKATGDLSATAIQGLLKLYDNPVQWSKAFNLQVRALFDEKVAGAFILDFNKDAAAEGTLTASEWAKASGRYGGGGGFLTSGSTIQPGGVVEKISSLPIIKQANRAFSTFGDTLRLMTMRDQLKAELGKGRTLAEITSSGDLGRIADGANVMTGWTRGETGGSLGRVVLFAPRWLQSQLETVGKAAQGLRPNATLDQAMARNALLKLIALGVLVTVAANAAQDNDTDFRPIVDGKRNPRFMRIKYGGQYYSVFGPWDSLLGTIINIGTGRPLEAIRQKGSGIVSTGWDLITGKDYDYKPVGSRPFNAGQLAQWILKSSIPFSAGQIPEGISQMAEGEVIPGAVKTISTVVGIKGYSTGEREATKKLDEATSLMGKFDQKGLDVALKQAENDNASASKIAAIEAEPRIYDIKSYRRDIGGAIGQLKDDQKAGLSPVVANYFNYSKQKESFAKLSTKEQEAYIKSNPGFVSQRIFWGDQVDLPDLKTAEAVAKQAQEFSIELDLIPAFQLTDKGKERIPSDRNLWKPFFDYYDLPGSGGYLSYSKEWVDAGKLPDKYLKDWQTYNALKTDTAKAAFRLGHKEAAKSTWRDDFRRANTAFDQWLISQGSSPLKTLSSIIASRRPSTGTPTTRISTASAGSFSGGSSIRRGKAKTYPKFKRPSIKMGMSVRAPRAPGV